MATQMDLDQQDQAAQLLKEGSRLLYTLAAGQFFEMGDVNAWFERYNALAVPLELSDPYGAISEQSSDDPYRGLADRAAALLTSNQAERDAWVADYRAAVPQIGG